jgi:SAM-dependent methyltransferase
MIEPDSDENFTRRRTSFGSRAATYDLVRPEWPARTVTWMLGSPTAATVCRVVDVGAGTGKGTRTIAALGHEVIAVEPSDGMREALALSLPPLPEQLSRRVSVLAGDAERIPVETGSADAVAAFQAWHWFDSEAAAAECARVLRPGGWLSMGWHFRSEDVGWSRELSDVVDHHAHVPDDQQAPLVGPGYEGCETELFDYSMRQSVEDLVLHASTWSYVATSPDRDRVLDEVRTLGRSVADVDGLVDIPMKTRCYRFRRH